MSKVWTVGVEHDKICNWIGTVARNVFWWSRGWEKRTAEMAEDPLGALMELHESLKSAAVSGSAIDTTRAAAIALMVQRICMYEQSRPLERELRSMVQTAMAAKREASDPGTWAYLANIFNSNADALLD